VVSPKGQRQIFEVSRPKLWKRVGSDQMGVNPVRDFYTLLKRSHPWKERPVMEWSE